MRFIFSNVSLTPQTRLSRFTLFCLPATHWSLRDGRRNSSTTLSFDPISLTTGHHKTSLALFNHMLANKVQPINLTFPSLIKAACSSFSVSYGVALHGQALKRGVLWDPFVRTSFVRFYGEVGDLRSSREMFHEIVDPCFKACNSMLDACGRNGEMDSAFDLFRRMPVTDVVSWTTVINGFGKNGSHDKALMLFREMIENSHVVITPNEATLVSVLSSCANLDQGGVHLGKQIHGYVYEEGDHPLYYIGYCSARYVWKSRSLGYGIDHFRSNL